MIEQGRHDLNKVKNFDIKAPGNGGLNLEDLEYSQTSNQSPKMLNMMYKNGAFGKRYGQRYREVEFDSDILEMGRYMEKIIVHAGTKIYSYDKQTETIEEIYTEITEDKGVFINFNRMLYYMNGKVFLQYDGEEFKEVEPYAPDVVINRKPDGSYSDLIENYNRLGSAFKNSFNGDGTSKVYQLTDKELDEDSLVEITVDEKEVTDFTVDYKEGKVTFTTAPTKGQNNVVITARKTEQEYIDSILKCKYFCNYGGNNNSRLFAAGGGNSTYYYSDVFDASYFPENNYQVLGNAENDITGFGEQYNVLMIFKSKEIYSLSYYLDNEGEAKFTCTILNAKIGCDVPESIQLINNRLTWCSSVYGVCTINQTVIENERNVNVISRNINGGFRMSGLLQEENISKALSTNYDGKYWLFINSRAYVWDYTLSPYSDTGKPEYDAAKLSWYLFDNFEVQSSIVDERDFFYSRQKKIVELTDGFNDFGQPIHSYYQTPLFNFGLIDVLKNIEKMYVQVRADTPSRIKITYIAEEFPTGQVEPLDINVPTRLWNTFSWHTFGWTTIQFAETFMRKCKLKKISMLALLFENDELDRDMSMSAIRLMYSPVKETK